MPAGRVEGSWLARTGFAGVQQAKRLRHGFRGHKLAIALAVVAGLLSVVPAAATGAAGNIVMAWGSDFRGQLGNGVVEYESELPVPVSGLSGVTAISAGGEQSLALLENETVMAWGSNSSGQLGDGRAESSDMPVPVSGLEKVRAISAGDETSMACGQATNACQNKGKAMGWGDNEYGQLGDKSSENSDLPVAAKIPSDVLQAISAGGEDSLAIAVHLVYAWGGDEAGELGNGKFEEESDEPHLVHAVSGDKYLNEVVAVSAGREDNLALLENGTVVAWGDNEDGQLGDGNTTDSNNPVLDDGLKQVKAISAGGEHNLALQKSGKTSEYHTS
jgi:alpha-tubulin suppressor-like RCC1 family protein